MGTETIVDEKKKIPGSGRGTGRKLGCKNVLAPAAKQSMAQFFESLTADNYRWRTRVKRILDGERGTTEQEFHKWSLLALDRYRGTSAKHQPEGEKRQSLYFVTTTGLYSWQMDNMKEQTDRMIQQGKDEARSIVDQP
jgi:hypothetical protein